MTSNSSCWSFFFFPYCVSAKAVKYPCPIHSNAPSGLLTRELTLEVDFKCPVTDLCNSFFNKILHPLHTLLSASSPLYPYRLPAAYWNMDLANKLIHSLYQTTLLDLLP